MAEAPEKSIITDEMKEAQKASAKATTEARAAAKEDPATGTGVLRKRGTGPSTHQELRDSDIPYPVEIHGNDFEHYGPQGMGAVIPDGTEIAAYAGDQEFMVDPEQVKVLKFGRPGRNLPGRSRLYTVKAIHKDRRLVQLPFEEQIQNTAGGDLEDAIGLRRYQRKGIHILIDWNTLLTVYCAAWDCWAQASEVDTDGNLVPLEPAAPSFCTLRHAAHTMPNKYKDAGAILSGMFGDNATTSRTWKV